MKLKLEKFFYNSYKKMNAKRKASEPNPIFRFFDKIRRDSGFVK